MFLFVGPHDAFSAIGRVAPESPAKNKNGIGPPIVWPSQDVTVPIL